MKKAKLKFGFVFICIILSFFSCAYAAKVENPSEVGQAGATAVTKNRTLWNFTCNKTGVYEVKLVDGEDKNGTDWFIQTSGGNDLRLACYETQDESTGERYYQLYCPVSSVSDTSCKVILFEGQSYKVASREAKRRKHNLC